MIDYSHMIYRSHISFTGDMHRLLGEALMWPVLAWLVWVIVQRTTRKRGAA